MRWIIVILACAAAVQARPQGKQHFESVTSLSTLHALYAAIPRLTMQNKSNDCVWLHYETVQAGIGDTGVRKRGRAQSL